jgi:hypothetical protein
MTSADISETAVHVDTVVYYPDLLTGVDIRGTVVHGSDTPVKSADSVHGSDMTVKSAVETTAVEPAMPPASVPSARVGKIRLAEDDRAQQRSCNAYNGPCPPGDGFVIA